MTFTKRLFHTFFPSRSSSELRSRFFPTSTFGTSLPSMKSEEPTPVPRVSTSSTPFPEMAPKPCMSASLAARSGFFRNNLWRAFVR